MKLGSNLIDFIEIVARYTKYRSNVKVTFFFFTGTRMNYEFLTQ
jgi:hypothetical protein